MSTLRVPSSMAVAWLTGAGGSSIGTAGDGVTGAGVGRASAGAGLAVRAVAGRGGVFAVPRGAGAGRAALASASGSGSPRRIARRTSAGRGGIRASASARRSIASMRSSRRSINRSVRGFAFDSCDHAARHAAASASRPAMTVIRRTMTGQDDRGAMGETSARRWPNRPTVSATSTKRTSRERPNPNWRTGTKLPKLTRFRDFASSR